MNVSDLIFIEGLTLWAHIGVTSQERAVEQRIELDIQLTPRFPLTGLGDELSNTVDYTAVAAEVGRIVAARQRALIETLAEEVAQGILDRFAVTWVAVSVRKFILAQTRSVGIRIERSKALASPASSTL